MTHPDDNQRDEPGKATPGGPVEPDLPLDEDAAWRSIVENYGEEPDVSDPSPGTPPPVPAAPDVFDRSYLDALDARRPDPGPDTTDSWADEGHFVPPEPPPLPRATPARRLAWLGLFGAPALMLLAVVFGWTYPALLSVALVASFVGGFVFLVATMSRHRGDWPGDDGAVV